LHSAVFASHSLLSATTSFNFELIALTLLNLRLKWIENNPNVSKLAMSCFLKFFKNFDEVHQTRKIWARSTQRHFPHMLTLMSIAVEEQKYLGCRTFLPDVLDFCSKQTLYYVGWQPNFSSNCHSLEITAGCMLRNLSNNRNYNFLHFFQKCDKSANC